jgi:acyl dehydratase
LGVGARHILAQRRVMAAVGRTAMTALAQRMGGSSATPAGAPEFPRPVLTEQVTPPPAALVRDYVRSVGGDPSAYRGHLPPHLFPQWTFPLAARTLDGLPYPLLRVMNGGCRLTVNAPLPVGEPLMVRAQLVSVDDNGRRVVLHQRLVTETASVPEALIADLYAIVPTAPPKPAPAANGHQSNGHNGQNGHNGHNKKETALVPVDARELAYWGLRSDAGWSFAMLTGDINPVHWLRPYAQAFGFRAAILHGFATLARTMEGLNRGLSAGAVNRLRCIDVRFSRPLPLPARVGLYVGAGNTVFVGDAAGGFAYLNGRFEERTAS